MALHCEVTWSIGTKQKHQPLFWLASCQHQLAHALSEGQTGLFKGFQSMAVSTAPKICAHTWLYSSAAFYSCGRYTTELQDLVVLSLAPLSPRIQFSRSCMHFPGAPCIFKPSIALSRVFFFFPQDPLWCLKTCLQKFLSYDGDPFHGKVKVLSHSSHVWL